MEESVEYTCDLCKISYATESELKEHVFSLMHHIKMEKKQKGVTHHCSLCLTSCSNIIEYGKHLNEDKHKQSVEKSRRALDDGPNPKPTDLDFSREKDDRNRDNLEDSSMDFSPVKPQFQIPESSSKHHPKGSHNSSSNRGRLNHMKHQRSFSQPEIKSKCNGIQVPRGKQYEEDFHNDFVCHDIQGQSMDDGYFSGQFPRGVQPDFDNTNWHNVNFIDYERFDPRNQFHSHSGNIKANQPHWYEDNITQEFYTDFQKGDSNHLNEKERFHQRFGEYSEMDTSSNRNNHVRRQDHMNHGRPVSNHLHGVRRESGEEFLEEERVSNIREARLADRKDPESVIQQATTNFPQDGPVEDHAPKRRRHDDEMISPHKSRKGNRNEKMDFRPSSRPSSVTSKHHATSHNRERHESPVRDISLSLINSSGDFVKNISQKKESKSRRSSIDKSPLSVNEGLQSSGISSLQSSTVSSLDSSGISDRGFVSSPKPVKGKKKDTVVGKSQGSKKGAAEKSKHGSKTSPGQNIEETAETVLERAERLCKDLRDKRETAKKERDLKEKQKKLEKHQELNSQLEALSSKNMENIKGHLNSEGLDNSTNSQFYRSLPSRLADSDCSLTGRETKQLSRTGSLSGLLNSRSDLDSLASSGSKQKEDIDRIRQTIENSVRGGSSSPVARSGNTPSSWPTSPLSPLPVPNTLAKTKILDKEHLCKLVNTPRSHKERLQLAQLLRTYASTRNKLSLPRFNLQMSGIYDKLENQTEDMCLVNLSPDVQLQIAQLIEADAKPNLQELESILNFGSLPVGTSLSGDLKHAAVMEQSAASPSEEPSIAPKHHEDVSSTHDLLRAVPSQPLPFPSKVEPRDAISPSPSRMDVDTSPAMTLQDLATDVSKSKQSVLTSPDSGLSRMPFSPLMSTFPERNRPMRVTSPDRDLAANVTVAGKGTTEQTLSSVLIKQERVDNDYDVGLNNNTSIKTECPDDILASGYTELSPVRDSSRGLLTRATVKDFFSASMSPLNHPVSRVTNQQNDEEEWPVRDISSPYVMPTLSSTPAVGLGVKSKHPLPSTTHQISSTITDVPAIYSSSSEKEREDKIQTIVTTTLKTCPELDARMETKSVVSQESGNSVLDQVYQLSLREEEIRKEIDASDHRMSQLRRLITEATNQLEKFTQKREMLLKEEVQLRSKRMKLLHESRSSQGSSTGPLQGMDSLGLSSPSLSRPQTENYDNPMLMKYLMSQRQHQFETASSVDGFSGVESGSQAEPEKDPTQCEVNLGNRRGSFTSDISSVTQDDKHIEASSVPGKTVKKGDSQLKFEQQSIHPSGAVELMTDQSLEILSGSSTCSFQSSKPPAAESLRKDLEKKTSEEATSNPQLALAGFVTLDSLLKNNTEIGKVFQKSLKGTDFSMVLSPTSTFGPKKGTSSEHSEIKHNKEHIQAKELVSDDCVHSGSDVEKPPKAPRISMKYMGSLPSEGLDTETLRQQIIGESKSSKQLTYTLLTSHDALEQLKKLSSESGMGTSVSLTQSQTLGQTTTVDTAKLITRRGTQHADNDSNLDCLSIVSACSLGEKIKQICDSHAKDEDNMSHEPSLDTPRSGSQSDPDKTLVEEDLDKNLAESGSSASTGIVKDCFVVLDRLDVGCSKPVLVSEIEARSSRIKKPKSHSIDLGKVQSKSGDNNCTRTRTPSPMRKKLKTKRERDTQSRRKKKEGFILESSSDVNSAEEEDVMLRSGDSGQKLGCEGQKDAILSRATGSVPAEGNMGPELTIKKSLLDEVELETPTDSTEETGVALQLNRSDLIRDNDKLRVKPEVLKSFRAAVRNNLQSKSDSSVSQASPSIIQYKGPNLPVAAIQVFRGDLYVCYHGNELRRFHLQTGECLKELDCSPFFVSCLHVTQASDTQNVLYTGGKCKKLMLFRPENFDILQSHDYDDQIKCLHQNWGRLYIGLSDGVVAVRSIKEDKKLDTFQCTDQPICCMSTTSAGMTKLLCCGTADSLVYICDAMSGILLTMLHGHKRPPVCIKAFDQTVISGSLDSTLLAHNVNTGALEQSCSVHPDAVTDIGLDDKHIYTSCADKYIRCFDRKTWKLTKTCHGAGRRPLTVINVTDRLVITGNIDGLVEAVPLNKLDMQAVTNEPTSSTAQ